MYYKELLVGHVYLFKSFDRYDGNAIREVKILKITDKSIKYVRLDYVDDSKEVDTPWILKSEFSKSFTIIEEIV